MRAFKWLTGLLIVITITLALIPKPSVQKNRPAFLELDDPIIIDWLGQQYPLIFPPDESERALVAEPLPAYFNTYDTLVAENFIRDQGTAATCWAFAANTLMEVAIAKDFGERYDFSENHLIRNSPIPATAESGGNFFMSWVYYLNHLGPITEEGIISPYRPKGYYEINDDIIAIKSAILNRGAALSSIYLNEKDEAVYNKQTASYYNSQSEKRRSHELVLVGWDDHYSKELFATKPTTDGAFIAQNSFGTGWGEKGLFYVSYEDVHIKGHVFVLDKLSYTSSNEVVYYRDETGLTHFESIEESLTPTAILPFVPSKNQVLKQISLYTGTSPLSLELYWGSGAFSGDLGPIRYQFDHVAKGYQTLPLPIGFSVLENEPYWVAVRFNGDKKFIVPIEAPYPGIDYTISGKPNEGYLMGAGKPVDLFTLRKNANLAIRLIFE